MKEMSSNEKMDEMVSLFLHSWICSRGLCNLLHCTMALWLPKGDDVMAKIHTKTYLLDNDRRVTVKSVAERVGISPSAARNRLDKHTDPDKIYAPYSSNGGLKKKKAKTIEKIRPYKDPMFILVMKSIGG